MADGEHTLCRIKLHCICIQISKLWNCCRLLDSQTVQLHTHIPFRILCCPNQLHVDDKLCERLSNWHLRFFLGLRRSIPFRFYCINDVRQNINMRCSQCPFWMVETNLKIFNIISHSQQVPISLSIRTERERGIEISSKASAHVINLSAIQSDFRSTLELELSNWRIDDFSISICNAQNSRSLNSFAIFHQYLPLNFSYDMATNTLFQFVCIQVPSTLWRIFIFSKTSQTHAAKQPKVFVFREKSIK